MAIRQSPEDYFGQSQRSHEQAAPVYAADPFYEPSAHIMVAGRGESMNTMQWGFLILALVAIVGIIGLLAVLGTKDRK